MGMQAIVEVQQQLRKWDRLSHRSLGSSRYSATSLGNVPAPERMWDKDIIYNARSKMNMWQPLSVLFTMWQ